MITVEIHKVTVSKEPDQEDEPAFFEVTVITHYAFHFWKTEMVKEKICEDNSICNMLYLQGSVRHLSEKSAF